MAGTGEAGKADRRECGGCWNVYEPALGDRREARERLAEIAWEDAPGRQRGSHLAGQRRQERVAQVGEHRGLRHRSRDTATGRTPWE